MLTKTTSDPDRAALELAIVQCRNRNAGRALQITEKLRDEPWEEVADFAAYSCQNETLDLAPFQIPPCWIADPDNPDFGLADFQASFDGRHEAAALLAEMLSLGISRWHPDPRAAIREARRPPLKKAPA